VKLLASLSIDFISKFTVSLMLGADLSRPKRPTDPVLSLFCPMQRICAGDPSIDASD
jgi:hypothetical protein